MKHLWFVGVANICMQALLPTNQLLEPSVASAAGVSVSVICGLVALILGSKFNQIQHILTLYIK
jgi:hypothetical protein